MGEVSIPYNEEAVLDLIRKANKTNSQDNSLSDEEILSFLGAEDYSELEEEWLFWEDSKVPVMIYDFNNWLAEVLPTSDRLALKIERSDAVSSLNTPQTSCKRDDALA